VLINGRVAAALAEGSRADGVFGHGFTYSGHPVAAAVARETISILRERDIPARARATGTILAHALDKFRGTSLVRDVRSYGMLGAVEFDGRAAGYAPGALGSQLLAEATRHGVLLRAMGDTVVFAPPLISAPTEIEAMVARLWSAYEVVSTRLRAVGR
jgi:4-aminobutyrate--pyruvate transaminase